MTEVIVDHLSLENPLHRFIARVGFQLLFYVLIYLLFDLRDISRRLRRFEGKSSEETSANGENKPLGKEGN